jgi:hypothetical protein
MDSTIQINFKGKSILSWEDDDIETDGVGFVIKYKEQLFVITAGHVVMHHGLITGIKNGKSCKLNLVVYSPEFDLGVLTSNNLLDLIDKPIIDIEKIIPAEKENVYFTNGLDLFNRFIVSDVSLEQINSFNIPHNILITIAHDESKCRYNIFECSGLSGSPCFVNDKLIGYISMMDPNCKKLELNVTPTVCITRVLDEYIDTNKWKGICMLYSKISKNKVKKSYSIMYNKGDRLHTKDKIITINSLKVKDGMVYDRQIGDTVLLNTYIMMNYRAGDKINMEVIRNKVKISININAIPVNRYSIIPTLINYKNRFVCYNGMIFVELSEQLIQQYYLLKDKQLVGSFNKIYHDIKYKNKKKRIIVMIDASEKIINQLDNDLLKKCYNDRTFMYKYVPTLVTANNKLIKNINTLKRVLKKNGENKFILENIVIKC